MRIAIALLLAVTASASDTAQRDIDRFAQRVLNENPEVTSVGIAIARNGKPYYARAFGYADIENKTLATSKTGYYIASSTKSYTGLAAAILASRGVLDLDAPITKYLPEVKFAAPIDGQRITLRRLLTHTSGISNDPIVFRTAFTGEHTPAGLVALLDSSRPGKEEFRYDNVGYVVASMVMERVTGKPWQKLLDELVFTPLEMNHTTAYMSEARKWPLASGHDVNRGAELVKSQFGKNDSMMHAAGGIVTTPEDLAKWLAANINEESAAFKEAHRKQVDAKADRDGFKADGYGLGWYQADYDGDSVLFHLGGFEGWRAHVSFMPEKKLGVAVVTNSGAGGHSVLNLIAAYAYDRLLEKPDLEKKSAEALARFKAAQQQRKERFLADVEKRSKRPWMLQHPNAAYAGRYENPGYGTMVIEQKDDKLVASLAQLSAVVEAFTEPESARVELVPGSGEVLRFIFTSGEKPDAVKWGDETFQRSGERASRPQ